MSEKTVQAAERQLAKKERFEFIFTINDFIVCQRYFYINGFKNKSLKSTQFVYAFNECVNLIKADLESKSRIYEWYCAPQVFSNAEEMNRWVENPTFELQVPTQVILNDTKENFIWDGTKMVPYNGIQNVTEFVHGGTSEEPCVLKFAFLDNGREVISRVWDGNVYPRFVRTNIDLSNSKNRYDVEGVFAPIEAGLIYSMIRGKSDLIPQIVHMLCVTCSFENDSDYVTSETYGDKTYRFNLRDEWLRLVNNAESKCHDKTVEYFKTLY